MKYDEKYMKRAIELAKKGIGAVNPNPLVGAVIVKDDRIIGEGFHERYGELHAERNAFANATEDCRGAAMYVTLEPCCHYGKQPPCVMAIVEHGITEVYVGSDDPNSLVAGKGISYLRERGIKVYTQVLKEECDELNPIFFHYITTKTPYVMLKAAMTIDGKLASYSGKSKWISNERSRARVMDFRNQYMGIMVGINTVLADNPMLTCRKEGGRNPIRIILDTDLRTPIDSNIVKTADTIKTIIAAGHSASNEVLEKARMLEENNAKVLWLKKTDEGIDMGQLMSSLGQMGIDSVMLEGGGTVNFNAISSGLVNEINLFIAPKILGGKEALTPVEGLGFDSPNEAVEFKLIDIECIEDDVCLRYKRKEVC